MPGATTARFDDPTAPIAWKAVMMPHTVPNSPMNGVMLAVVANELAGAVGTALVGGLIAVVLHLMNLVMGMFSPFIQSIRLHLVEFNSRFYQGGGRPYSPFGYRPGG